MIAIAYDAARARHLLARKRKEVFMNARICKYAPPIALLASLGMAGCTEDGADARGHGAPGGAGALYGSGKNRDGAGSQNGHGRAGL